MSPLKTIDPRLITYNNLRKWVGALGIFLPLILIVGSLFIGDCHSIQESISHYYYTKMGNVFVGILCAVAFFLLIYKGYDRVDKWTTNTAGVFAIAVALFPTTENSDIVCAVLEYHGNQFTEKVHYLSAAGFFILLAYMSYFRFTRSDGQPTPEKLERNKVYKACGIIIVVAVGAIFLIHTEMEQLTESTFVVFVLEWVALVAFGISWLLKGEASLTDFLQDKKKRF